MDSTLRPEIRRFQRRISVAIFCGAFARAAGWIAVGLAAFVLSLRLFGVVLRPHESWLLALALPLAWGFWGARKKRFSAEQASAHLDRRLALGGLLMADLERGAGSWRERLEGGLHAAKRKLPSIRFPRLLGRLALPGSFLLAVLLIPPPVVPARTFNPLLQEGLSQIEEKLDLAIEEGLLPEEKTEELKNRLQELQSELRDGELVPWADLDALDAALGHEQSRQAANLEKALAELAEVSQGAESGEGSAALAEKLSSMLEQAEKAGLLQGLPPELAKQLGLDPNAASSGFDPSKLPVSPEELAKLAQALSESMGGQLGKFESRGFVEPGKLADLKSVLERFGKPEAFDPDHEHGPECQGGT